MRVAVSLHLTECLVPSLTFTNYGLVELVSNLLGDPYYVEGADYFKLDLYQNNVIPTATSKISDFQLANFEGYGSVSIGGEGMGPAVLFDGYAQLAAKANPITWVNNGTQQMVYGLIVSSLATDEILWVESFVGGYLLGFKQSLSIDFALNLYGEP